MIIKGIDVSVDQGQIDWAAVKDGADVQFAYAKATEGITYVDEQFRRNRTTCFLRKIPFGPYHFFRPNDDGVAQAEHFLSVAKPFGALLPMVDVEVADGLTATAIVNQLSRFVNRVEQELHGKLMIIYTGWSFWNTALAGSDAFAGHPLWVAAYPDAYDDSQAPPVPNGWKSATLWQYSESGQVSGIDGSVDLDRIEVPLSQIAL